MINAAIVRARNSLEWFQIVQTTNNENDEGPYVDVDMFYRNFAGSVNEYPFPSGNFKGLAAQIMSTGIFRVCKFSLPFPLRYQLFWAKVVDILSAQYSISFTSQFVNAAPNDSVASFVSLYEGRELDGCDVSIAPGAIGGFLIEPGQPRATGPRAPFYATLPTQATTFTVVARASESWSNILDVVNDPSQSIICYSVRNGGILRTWFGGSQFIGIPVPFGVNNTCTNRVLNGQARFFFSEFESVSTVKNPALKYIHTGITPPVAFFVKNNLVPWDIME
jgi:hypothetical protein